MVKFFRHFFEDVGGGKNVANALKFWMKGKWKAGKIRDRSCQLWSVLRQAAGKTLFSASLIQKPRLFQVVHRTSSENKFKIESWHFLAKNFKNRLLTVREVFFSSEEKEQTTIECELIMVYDGSKFVSFVLVGPLAFNQNRISTAQDLSWT